MANPVNDRRAVIMEAVVDLLAWRGMAGVTHRAADAAAGLPLGSTSYHYPRKADLVRAAASHLAAALGQDCDDLQIAFAEVAAREGLDAAVDHAARALTVSAGRGRRLLLARIELSLAAARDPDLAEVGRELTTAARRPIEFVVGLVAGDAGPAAIDATAGLLDGIGLLHATGQSEELTAEQAAAAFRALASSGATPAS